MESYFLKRLFIYLFVCLFVYERHTEAETRQREKQAPCREPNMGLNPRFQDQALG